MEENLGATGSVPGAPVGGELGCHGLCEPCGLGVSEIDVVTSTSTNPRKKRHAINEKRRVGTSQRSERRPTMSVSCGGLARMGVGLGFRRFWPLVPLYGDGFSIGMGTHSPSLMSEG